MARTVRAHEARRRLDESAGGRVDRHLVALISHRRVAPIRDLFIHWSYRVISKVVITTAVQLLYWLPGYLVTWLPLVTFTGKAPLSAAVAKAIVAEV